MGGFIAERNERGAVLEFGHALLPALDPKRPPAGPGEPGRGRVNRRSTRDGVDSDSTRFVNPE